MQAHQTQRPASTYLTGGSTTRISRMRQIPAAEHCFSAAREHTARGPFWHRQPEHAAKQCTAACKHLSDRRQRDKKSAVCGFSAESAVFGQKAGREAAQPRQNVSANKSSGVGNPTLTQFLKNSMDWHKTSDPDKRAQLHAQNDALRRKLGYDWTTRRPAPLLISSDTK